MLEKHPEFYKKQYQTRKVKAGYKAMRRLACKKYRAGKGKVKCTCGTITAFDNRLRHLKSKQHQSWAAQNPDVTALTRNYLLEENPVDSLSNNLNHFSAQQK